MGNNAQAHVTDPFPSTPDEKEGEPMDQMKDRKIKLGDFILRNIAQIVGEWEEFARTLKPPSAHMTPLTLRDHIHELLAFIVSDIKSAQSPSEQIEKSHGENKKSLVSTAAETHASLRLAGGFNIDQMVSEYRALRASVIKQWGMANARMDQEDMDDLIRFNESIDQELAESVSLYTKSVSHSKDLFMAVLSHDLRNPLSAISMSADLIANIGKLDIRQNMLTAQISESASRIGEILNDLLDVTRARFGSQLPVVRAPMDMGFLSRKMVDEMRAVHPTRIIILEVAGDLKGTWDQARIGQVFSNLIGNALQYSFQNTSIVVNIVGTAKDVVLSVHNQGIPISSEKLETIFDSLTRASTSEADPTGSVNLGLGLFIAKDIVVSHGGTIVVTSTEDDGTEFIASFPRSA